MAEGSAVQYQRKSVDMGKGAVVYYICRLFPNRPVVVFLHGLSANHTVWLAIAGKLHEAGCNTLIQDLRGHGASDKAKDRSHYALSVFADDLVRIIQRETIERFVLVGYSFGGSIALEYATRHPRSLAGLVLISTNYTSPLKYKGLDFLTSVAAWLLRVLARALIWQKRKTYYTYDHTRSAGYWHSVWLGLNTMPLSINFWMLAEVLRADFRKVAHAITAPTLIIRAKSDPFLSEQEARDMAEAIPRSRIITLDRASHFIASGSQEEVSRILLDFLNHYEDRNF